ncbi:MAG: 3-phosphoshikimate 1-carboxyvinyltransferase [Methanoregula sp.]|nr:3-phosphoshikimate 1-carboxyvinyltransferase [Methanoregula sp.]
MIVTPSRVRGIDYRFTAPPSKSFTHRAMIIAALANGMSILHNPLIAQDTELTARALEALGTRIHYEPGRVRIAGSGGHFSCGGEKTLDLQNSGTSLRLLTSLALLCDQPVVLTGSARMQERPIGPLADAISSLGGTVEFLQKTGYPPVRVHATLKGGTATIDGTMSSQFISSLLLVAPYAEQPVELVLPNPPVSRSYLDVTVNIMRAFGAQVFEQDHREYSVSNRQRYQARTYEIEGDYSSASYFFAIAAICGGRVTVENLRPGSVQGDHSFPGLLGAMGCTVQEGSDSITVERTGKLSGIECDMSSSPDTVQTLCMVAAMAGTPTTITGISHLKFKESDRITGTARLLNNLGGDVQAGADTITINPSPLHGGTIDPVNDHRTAMSFAVLGLGIGGITIEHAECTNKSFPGFWDALAGAGP